MRNLLLLLVMLAMMGCPKGGGDLPSPGPAPGYVPSAEMQSVVAKFVPISEPDLASFYGDFADLVRRDADSKIIGTTDRFRTINETAGQLRFQNAGLKGKYPTLGTDLDATTNGFLGTKVAPLDYPKTQEYLKALEWALQ